VLSESIGIPSHLSLPSFVVRRLVYLVTNNHLRRAMTKHMTGTRKEWLAARLDLLKAEKELTRLSARGARSGRPLGHVPVARPRPQGRNETGVWWRRHDEYDKC
jgi:predicted dithiol-disulfide oxidoreductase (DUF899 family)